MIVQKGWLNQDLDLLVLTDFEAPSPLCWNLQVVVDFLLVFAVNGLGWVVWIFGKADERDCYLGVPDENPKPPGPKPTICHYSSWFSSSQKKNNSGSVTL